MIAPAKRGVPVLLHVFAVEIISIHAPVWGRWQLRTWGQYPRADFNSRPRVGADHIIVVSRLRMDISIHAPVWGRAYVTAPVDAAWTISIHAPVWGRGGYHVPEPERENISIHAPVWGRGDGSHGKSLNTPYFNSRPRVGAGLHISAIHGDGRTAYFNSRPRVGAGAVRERIQRDKQEFQFTPPCGGGPGSMRLWFPATQFQFTPPCGGREAIPAASIVNYFNSRPRVGAGGIRGIELPIISYFNSRPRVGAGCRHILIC